MKVILAVMCTTKAVVKISNIAVETWRSTSKVTLS